jgi:trimeric autotransporter adhesin
MKRRIGGMGAVLLAGLSACEERVVSPALVDTVIVEPETASLEVGKTREFEAVFIDADGNELRGREVTWSVADPAIAEIDGAGRALGLTPGETRVIAVVEGRQGDAVLSVVRRNVASVRIEPTNPTVILGRTMTLRAFALDDEGGELSDRSVTWSTRDASVVPVTSSGVITGQRLGSTTVEAEVEGRQAGVSVTVSPPALSAMEVRPGSVALEVDDTIRLAAVGRAEDGDDVPGLPVEWSSGNANVATVTSAGLVTAVAPGETQIRASFGGRTGEATVTVRIPPAASVRVEPSSASLVEGSSTRLTATARDSRGRVVEKEFTWSTSNGAVATVDGSGLVTARSAGTAFIIARTEGVRDSAVVLVTPRPVQTVQIEPANPTIFVTQEVQLEAILRAADGTRLTGRTVEWTSSNGAVASVNNEGRVRGLLTGQATITARSEGRSGTTTVTVTAVPVARISVTPPSPSIDAGGTVQLTATVFDADDNVLLRTVTWSSSASGTATVSGDGLVTGVAPGQVTIRASAGGVDGESAVTVRDISVARVQVTPSSATLLPGETVQLQATVYDANDNVLSRSVSWTTTSAGVATVSGAGMVTAVSPGQALIRATVDGISGEATITVNQVPVARVEVSPSSATLLPGETVQLQATVYDANDNVLDRPVSWATSNSSVATVSGSGTVTAVAAGSATITASSGGQQGASSITVNPLVSQARIEIEPSSVVLEEDDSIQLTATVYNDAGNPVSVSVSWSSSNTQVARVNSSGRVTARDEGTATIFARALGLEGRATVRVVDD